MQIREVVIAARNRYMLINWMVNIWSHDLHNWINHMVLHIGITSYSLTVCLHIFWSLNGGLKFCKFCDVFVICRKVRVVLVTKILCFWLFSVLSHQSWIKFFSVVGQDNGSWVWNAMGTPGLHERRVCSFGRDQIRGMLQSFVRTSSLFFRS